MIKVTFSTPEPLGFDYVKGSITAVSHAQKGRALESRMNQSWNRLQGFQELFPPSVMRKREELWSREWC